MPSPVPGIDPYIQRQAWEDFDRACIIYLRDQLSRELRPNYVVRSEDRLCLEHTREPERLVICRDVTVLQPPLTSRAQERAAGSLADLRRV